MDWGKAKNLTIIFLLILNMCLGALVYVNSAKYVLTQDEEAAIVHVLKQNRISLYDQIQKKYAPMAQIQLEPENYDTDQLIHVFFEEGASLSQTIEYDKLIFSDEQERTLTFSGNHVFFENSAPSADSNANSSNPRELCDRILAQNPQLLPGFVFDNPNPNGIKTKDGYRLEYRQLYKNNLIYSNYVAFTMRENSIIRVEYSYRKPVGFEKKPKEIASPDEALFALMQHILDMYGTERETIINRMDIVYYPEETLDENVASLKTVPCYRFWVEGNEKPYLINAYTGGVVE